MQRLRAYALLAAVLILAAWLAMIWYPVRNSPLRLGIAACAAAFPPLILFLVWKWKIMRWTLMALLAIPIGFLFLPGAKPDAGRLRERYITTLRGYTGTRYTWGGENGRGVDCSGLIRAAMFDACIAEGIRTANPGLLRHALWLWWNDASAHELSLGYDGQVIALAPPMPLKQAESQMLPGDFATWPDGVHVIAKLHKGDWIEADPESNHVQIFTVAGNPVRENQAALPCRWQILQSR